jgi:hypothetical protein
MGRDRDESGHIIPGARIKTVYDLIERGLAWKENVTTMPEFLQLVKEIRELYPKL